MKPRRITDGTCYNGTHWLDKEDCGTCTMKVQCIDLNKMDTEGKQQAVVAPVTTPKLEQIIQIPKTTTNARAIENELLAGGDIVTVIKSVATAMNVSEGKIRNQVNGIRKKIQDKSGKWDKYQDISTEGHLQIKLR